MDRGKGEEVGGVKSVGGGDKGISTARHQVDCVAAKPKRTGLTGFVKYRGSDIYVLAVVTGNQLKHGLKCYMTPRIKKLQHIWSIFKTCTEF